MKRTLFAGQPADNHAQDDADLVTQFRAGDMRAFDMLLERYENRMFNFIYRMLGDYQNAQEVTQEVFLRAFRYLGNFRGESKFSTWLFTIASSTCKNAIAYYHIREKYQHKAPRDTDTQQELDPLQIVPDYTSAPERHLDRAATSELLVQALNELPDNYRKVIVLKDVNDFSYEDIGGILGIPAGTVKSRLSRARLLLREKLTRLGCLSLDGA
jgi:RNA polymerase sigma-70 factor, ECF subfamily